MNIGFDGSRAFTENKTGTENYSFQLLKHLAKIDTENNYVVYVRPTFCHSGQHALPSGVDPESIKQEILHTPPSEVKQVQDDDFAWPSNFTFSIINYSFLWTQIGLSLQTFKDDLDVLFVPSHTLPLFRKPGLKTVMTVHDLGAEYLPSHHQLKQRLYLNLMTHYQLKTASHLIAVSEATKSDLVKRIGVNQEKISVIYEGYNSELKVPNNDLLNNTLKRYGIKKDSYFLFVGTIQPRKNLERLIKAYAQYSSNNNSPSLVLAGGKGWLSDDIYELPKRLGIEDKVKFLGYVPNKDLPSLYCGARAFLFPSLFEGFGLPILEAFNFNCPVLTSNTSSMPEVAGDAAVLVDPYSIDSIKDGILRVQAFSSEDFDSELSRTAQARRGAGIREQLIKKGQQQLRKFSWEKAARETLNILQEVAKR